MNVVYFDYLLGAACTSQLVKILFFAFSGIVSYFQMYSHRNPLKWVKNRYPSEREASREVANLTERKNPHAPHF